MNDRKLTQWKQEYDAIPIPPELEGKVQEAVRRGKAARRSPVRWFRRVGTTAAAAMVCLVALANVGPGVSYAMEQVPVLGSLVRVVTFRTFEDRQNGASAKVEVPQVQDGGSTLNDAIQSYTDQVIAMYQHDAAQAAGAEGAHYALDLSYTVVTDNDRLFALRFDQTLVMASGVQSVKIYNVDKQTGTILSLSDLFQPDSDWQAILLQEVQRQMRERMAQDPDTVYWVDQDMESMNLSALPEDLAFYFNDQGQLVLVFNEGDAGPMYLGVVEFTIPDEAVSAIARPGFWG